MMILSSNGLSSEPLLTAAKKHAAHGNAALVVTADHVYKERNYHVERVSKELKHLGLTVDYFDFDTQTPQALSTYDCVELIGGNPYYLLHSILSHGFQSVLKTFAESKMLIGWSAGASVLGPNLALINLYTPEMNIVNLNDLSALHFTDIQILPHYGKFLTRFPDFEERCAQYEQNTTSRVIRLNDGEGIIIDGQTSTLIQLSSPS